MIGGPTWYVGETTLVPPFVVSARKEGKRRRRLHTYVVVATPRLSSCSVFKRHVKCGETRIREHSYGRNAEVAAEVACWDICSYYGSLLKTARFPVGPYIVRRRKDGFRGSLLDSKRIHDSIIWMSWLQFTELHCPIRTLMQAGECKLYLDHPTPHYIRPDGFYLLGNGLVGVLEFLECGGSHGLCPPCLRRRLELGRKESGRSRKLRQESMQRLRDIAADKSIGSVRYTWSCAWSRRLREDRRAADFAFRFVPGQNGRTNYATEGEVIDALVDDETVDGYLLLTVALARHKIPEFDAFPCFFDRWPSKYVHCMYCSARARICLAHSVIFVLGMSGRNFCRQDLFTICCKKKAFGPGKRLK